METGACLYGEKKLKVTVSGLPANCRSDVTFDNFKPGAVYSGKLLQKSVSGGVILVPTDFTIKEFDMPVDHHGDPIDPEEDSRTAASPLVLP